jgi:tRNA wybutosine-synthesizing protein 2
MESRTRTEIYEYLGSISEEIRKNLPEAYEKIGDLLIIHLNPIAISYKEEIGEAYRKAFNVKTVLLKGKIHGEYRIPDYEIIAGSDTKTIHKENSILYSLDLSKVMFSSGNIQERIRMSTLPHHEKVVDMFAGIGYFTLPIAKFCHSHVSAVEKNENAYNFLCENVVLNEVQHLVTLYRADCKNFEGKADRVIMGHPDSHKYLDIAFRIVEKGFIHYHEFTPEGKFERPRARLERAAEEAGAHISIQNMQKIKKYSPGVWHIVCDIQVH